MPCRLEKETKQALAPLAAELVQTCEIPKRNAPIAKAAGTFPTTLIFPFTIRST
jgi:H+/gluconate symporter-like permease